MLIDRPLRELLDAFRSPDPTPGGGSASALAGALGAALLSMVAGLPRPRAAADADLERLASARARTSQLSDELAALVDRDSQAYDAVIAAFRMPKASEEDKRVRAEHIQRALTEATAVPLEVMRKCAAALEEAPAVAASGNPNASSDVQVAIELLAAAIRGANLNVEINLGGLKDARRADEIRTEAARLRSGIRDRS